MRRYTPFGASASLGEGANIRAGVAQEIFPTFGINGILSDARGLWPLSPLAPRGVLVLRMFPSTFLNRSFGDW